MKQQIILVRGLPGSGKTTYAKTYVESNFKHVESDMWFETKDGYKFSIYDISIAHAWCTSEVERLIRIGHNVIVSNTFTVTSECAPYYVIADKYDCAITIIECAGEFGSIHDVPLVTLEAMRLRWQSRAHIEDVLHGKDMSVFSSNPYEAYKFFSTLERIQFSE